MKIRTIGPAGRLIIGAILGILAGVIFGDYCKVLNPIGVGYVMLLQAPIYPLLVSALIHGLGTLSPCTFGSLFKRGWIFYLAAWGITLGAIFILVQAIPRVNAPFVINPAQKGQSASSILQLFLPANLFTDIAGNLVPAVVIFSVLYGLAIQRFKNKENILNVFEAISTASIKIWNWVAILAPIGVFALFADLAGTVSLAQLESLTLYILLFAIGSVVLAFWVLPAVISALTDLPIRKLLKTMRNGIIMGAVTTISATAIPYVIEAVGKLAAEHNITDEKRETLVKTTVSITYPLGQLGNLFVYLFMFFSFYYFKQPVDIMEQVLLPILTLLSSFGSPTAAVNSVAFLSAWLNIPGDATELFVETLAITRYFQVIATVVGFYFIPILVIFAFYGRLKIKPFRLISSLVIPALIFGIITFGLFHLEGWLIPRRVNTYLSFSLPESVTNGVDVTVHKTAETVEIKPEDASLNETSLDRIKRTGVLRVGYNVFPIPFCYLNNKGELVGYDVAFAYELARSLNVKLVFIPFDWNSLVKDLKASHYDIAMAGIYVTNERIESVKVSDSYFRGPLVMVVPSKQAHKFLSRQKIAEIKDLKIAVFYDQVFLNLVNETFPQAQMKVVSNLEEMAEFNDFDAVISNGGPTFE